MWRQRSPRTSAAELPARPGISDTDRRIGPAPGSGGNESRPHWRYARRRAAPWSCRAPAPRGGAPLMPSALVRVPGGGVCPLPPLAARIAAGALSYISAVPALASPLARLQEPAHAGQAAEVSNAFMVATE